MTDFLLELRSEEIPARMQAKAKDDLARLFAEEIAKAGLKADALETFATPRRLALIARGLPDQTESVSEERKGPRANAPEQALAGFLRSTGLTREKLTERDGVLFAVIDKPGRPTQAIFIDVIIEIMRSFPWSKSMRWGNASISTESLRWVRPLQGIVALFGTEEVRCEFEGIQSGRETVGHRFHSPGPVSINSADTYVEQLRAAHVIVHLSERRKLIEEGAAKAAAAAGLTVIPDEGLVLENAGLTEWPVPLLGRFDPAFLDVPREVIQLTMRTNQKYFACADAEGKLANAFICTANLSPSDGGAAVIAGNEKVLSARLSDAKFFWEQDLKIPLEEQAKKLKDIVFHEKLGTVANKVDRVAKLARWLVEEGVIKSSPERGGGPRSGGGAVQQVPSPRAQSPLHHPADGPPPLAGEDLATLAETAARLCKADLVTGVVGEFPELQGIMGGYYARAQGHPDAVADAIRDHYKPVGQGDDVPTAPATVAVSFADKLDTLVGFFAVGLPPTGSKDPFALRRAALGLSSLLLTNNLRLPIRAVLLFALRLHWQTLASKNDWLLLFYPMPNFRGVMAEMRSFDTWEPDCKVLATQTIDDIDLAGLHSLAETVNDLSSLPSNEVDYDKYSRVIEIQLAGPEPLIDVLLPFLIDRLKVQQREAGVRHDLIDAVFALGGEDDLVRLLARVKALQSFVTTDEGKNLLAGYKRAANILKKEGIEPLPFRGGAGGGDSTRETSPASSPHPNPSPEGEGLQNSLFYTPEPAEHALINALDSAEPLASAAIKREDFEGAMAALASLRAPIDAFFETVTVNDADPAKRDARLALLARVRDAVNHVADFSKIEG